MARARVIDGKAVADRVTEQVRREVEAFKAEHGSQPVLSTVLVGEDEASKIYVGRKEKACRKVGIGSIGHHLPEETRQAELLSLIEDLNASDEINGILVQLPLPEQIDAHEVMATINPAKDVDGLTPTSAGLLVQGRQGLVPCTPAGVMELLRASEAELEGATAVVLGRSNLVGKPMAFLLLAANATVTLCHSRTLDLAAVCSRADVLVAAVGRARLVGPEMVKPGATVIDVGMNRTDEGLAGDVDFDAVAGIAGAITPVPGGVGPMTIAMLLRNTLEAALSQIHRGLM